MESSQEVSVTSNTPSLCLPEPAVQKRRRVCVCVCVCECSETLSGQKCAFSIPPEYIAPAPPLCLGCKQVSMSVTRLRADRWPVVPSTSAHMCTGDSKSSESHFETDTHEVHTHTYTKVQIQWIL